MPKVIVLKPFTFSHPPDEKTRITKEDKFSPDKDVRTGAWVPTEVDLPDAVYSHEWISDQYADGAIEDPKVTKQRVKDEKDRLARIQEDNAIQLAKAEQAMTRAGGYNKPVDLNNEDVQRELNTPVNELKGQRGTDIEKPAKAEKADKKAKE